VQLSQSNESPLSEPKYRCWLGVLLSLLIPGSGLFLAGHRASGVRWFIVLSACSLLLVVLAPLTIFPGIIVLIALSCVLLILTIIMLVRSYRPVQKVGVLGWALFFLIAISLEALETRIAQHFMRPFQLPTRSMVPTLVPGDHVFVQTSRYWFSTPKRGDIVVFWTDSLESPLLPKGQFYTKRVAALSGDQVRVRNGRLLVNDHPVETPTILSGTNFGFQVGGDFADRPEGFLVPSNSCFVIGDNVTNSLDSRHFGPVPNRGIIGRVTKIYWPLRRIGEVR